MPDLPKTDAVRPKSSIDGSDMGVTTSATELAPERLQLSQARSFESCSTPKRRTGNKTLSSALTWGKGGSSQPFSHSLRAGARNSPFRASALRSLGNSFHFALAALRSFSTSVNPNAILARQGAVRPRDGHPAYHWETFAKKVD